MTTSQTFEVAEIRTISAALPQVLRKITVEMVGTFALVFAGGGAIMVNETTNGSLGHAGVAATFGLVVMVMIYATGHISGAHFDPAVTIAFAIAGRFPCE
jgi:aquaporin NIP